MLEKVILYILSFALTLISGFALWRIKKREDKIDNIATQDDLRKSEQKQKEYTDIKVDNVSIEIEKVSIEIEKVSQKQRQDKIDLQARQDEMMRLQDTSIQRKLDSMNEYMMIQFKQINTQNQMIIEHLLNKK